jgi:hypothetical protein
MLSVRYFGLNSDRDIALVNFYAVPQTANSYSFTGKRQCCQPVKLNISPGFFFRLIALTPQPSSFFIFAFLHVATLLHYEPSEWGALINKPLSGRRHLSQWKKKGRQLGIKEKCYYFCL